MSARMLGCVRADAPCPRGRPVSARTPRVRADAPCPRGRPVSARTHCSVRADAIFTARTWFLPRPRVNADAAGRPDDVRGRPDEKDVRYDIPSCVLPDRGTSTFMKSLISPQLDSSIVPGDADMKLLTHA
jgi:hypothetical protein